MAERLARQGLLRLAIWLDRRIAVAQIMARTLWRLLRDMVRALRYEVRRRLH